MKHITLTLIALFIGFNLYSQLNIPATKEYNFIVKNYETIIDTILSMNPNIDHSLTETFKYRYDNGEELHKVLFRDHSGYFLDILKITKEPRSWKRPNDLSYFIRKESSAKYDYESKRIIVDFETNYKNYYRLIFDDDSYIEIRFMYERAGRTLLYYENNNGIERYKFF